MKCNLGYNRINFVNQCVISLVQLAMKLFHDSYELLSKTHPTGQVGGDLVNMLYTHSVSMTTKWYLFIYFVSCGWLSIQVCGRALAYRFGENVGFHW